MTTRRIACIMAFLLAASAQAQSRTWDGGSTADSNWSSSDNWDGAVPVAGDALFFGGAARTANTNDLTPGLSIAAITFNSGAGAFTLSGNGLALGGDVKNLSGSAQTINLPLSLSGMHRFASVNVDFTVNGALSGAGGLIADATNKTFKLTASNSYDGVTYVTNGAVSITHGWALGSTNGYTMVYGSQNGQLYVSGGIETYEPITLKGQRPPYGQTLTCSGGSNTIWSQISKVNEIRLGGVGGSTLVFAGGIQTGSGGGDVVLNPGGGTFIFKGVINIGGVSLYLDQGGLISLAAAGNTWGDTRCAGGTMRADITNALPAATRLFIGVGYSTSGTFDLNGYDQTVGQLLTDTTNAGTRIVTSTKRATLTVNQSANTTYNGVLTGSLCLFKNGTGSLLLTNGTSTTAGDITVSNGTLAVAQSAGFSAISNMVVTGGTLDLRNQTAISDAAALWVSGSGVVAVGSGLNETVNALFINGVQQASGTWGSASTDATHTDSHFSGLGKITVLSGPPVAAVSVTWDGGDTGTLFSAATNWVGDTLPPFDGTAQAVFAAGGTTATVDAAVSLYGITFNSDTNFTVAGGAGAIALGSGGLAAKLPAAVSRTYRLEEDVTLTENQVWSVTNNGAGSATLVVSGSLGDSNSVYSLTKWGDGALVLSGSNTYDGATTVKTGGVLRITSSWALGSTNGATTVENGGWIEMSGNITVPEPIALYGDASTGYGGVLRSTGGSNVLSGLIINGSRLKAIGGSGSLDIIGGITGGQLVLGADGGSFIRVAEKPINIANTFFAHTGGLIILDVAGNTWPEVEVSGYYLRTDRDYALAPAGKLTIGSANPSGVNLNCTRQIIGSLNCTATGAGTRMVYSATPATLTVSQSVDTVYSGAITGAVTVVKAGTGTLTLSNTNTLYGAVAVSNGTLLVNGTGTLGPNCSSVAVSGGALMLSNSVAIADAATVAMPAEGVSTAKINLASGVNEAVRYLIYGGKQQRAGTYGSSASPAANKDDSHFAGAGVLTVLRDDFGTLIKLQ